MPSLRGSCLLLCQRRLTRTLLASPVNCRKLRLQAVVASLCAMQLLLRGSQGPMGSLWAGAKVRWGVAECERCL